MSKKTVYNFLELEFRRLYDDMKIFIEDNEPRKIFNNQRKLLKDIVYYISVSYTHLDVYKRQSLYNKAA